MTTLETAKDEVYFAKRELARAKQAYNRWGSGDNCKALDEAENALEAARSKLKAAKSK